MSRINTNVTSLVATRVLGANNKALSRSLERLSTGLRINSGKDDPSGLIASETLRSSKRAITAALDNANRADNIVSIAEGGLQEVNSLLLELEDLVDRSANQAGLSSDEVAANQLQIDSILQSINRIAESVSFGGRKLLNGNFAFSVSGVTASQIAGLQVNAARIPEGASRTVVVDVVTSAQSAGLNYTSGALSDNVTIQVRGNHGTEVFSFISGTTISSIRDAINTSTELTGVSAAVDSGTLVFNSTGYGRDALVSVETLSGTFGVSGGSDGTLDYGVDPQVTINGTTAVISNGLTASVRTGSLSVDITLAAGFATQTSTDSSFAITGGGAVFSLSPEVGLAGQESLGIQSVATGSLGNGTTGYLASLGSGQTNDLASGKFTAAQRIVRAAINQVSSLRGRIGAFQKDTLASTINALQVQFENTAAAESAIRDADFAVETSELTRAQILVNSATATLQLATAQPRNALALLGG
jgi:flagellin